MAFKEFERLGVEIKMYTNKVKILKFAWQKLKARSRAWIVQSEKGLAARPCVNVKIFAVMSQ